MKTKVIIVVVIALLAVGGIGYYFGFEKSAPAINSFADCAAWYPIGESYPEQCWTPDGRHFVASINPPPPGPITTTGEIACLPKTGEGAQTLECAIGLKAPEGYYGLKNLFELDPEYKFSAGGTQVEVSGMFNAEPISGPDGNNYNIIGVITLSSISEIKNNSIGEFWGSIFGVVMLGPTCPVVMYPPDPNCADKPYQTQLVVTTADQARVIKEFSSDTNGRFNVEVPPGQYAIRTAAAANILPYCASNETITVRPNDSAEVTVYCDTGIR